MSNITPFPTCNESAIANFSDDFEQMNTAMDEWLAANDDVLPDWDAQGYSAVNNLYDL